MKREPLRLLATLSMAASVLVLVACGGGAGGGGSQGGPQGGPGGGAPTVPAQNQKPVEGGGAPAKAEPVTLRYGYVAEPAQYWDVWAAIDQGFYEQENIRVEASRFDTTNNGLQALVTDAIHIFSGTPDVSILSKVQGSDVVMVANEQKWPSWDFVTQREIERFDQVKGKVLGVSQLKSASTLFLTRLLELHGVKQSEYQIIAVGGTGKRFAALQSGQVAGALLVEPINFKAKDAGYHILGNAAENSKVPGIIFSVRDSWAKANGDVLVRFLRATLKGVQWLRDPANRDSAVDLMVDLSQAERSLVERTYDKYIKEMDLYREDGVIPVEDVQLTMEMMKEIGVLTGGEPAATTYIDMSYLQQASGK